MSQYHIITVVHASSNGKFGWGNICPSQSRLFSHFNINFEWDPVRLSHTRSGNPTVCGRHTLLPILCSEPCVESKSTTVRAFLKLDFLNTSRVEASEWDPHDDLIIVNSPDISTSSGIHIRGSPHNDHNTNPIIRACLASGGIEEPKSTRIVAHHWRLGTTPTSKVCTFKDMLLLN